MPGKRYESGNLNIKKMLVLLLLTAFPVAGCDTLPDETNNDAGEVELEVISTIFPLADVVRQIGGDRVKVTKLLEAGDSPHTFEPTVEQARRTARADLLFYVGQGLDDWAVSLAEDEGVPGVKVTEHLEKEQILDYDPEHLEEDEDHQQEENGHHQGLEENEENENGRGHNAHDHQDSETGHEHHNSCSHGPHDPHVWLDPVLVKEVIAPLVAEQLSRKAPGEEKYFMDNLEYFQEKLAELHQEIKDKVKHFSRHDFISYHSAWNYYAVRYGLVEAASVEEFPGREPSAKWLAELADLAEEYGIDVIFAEPQLRKENARVIAEEIDGEVLVLDPLGGEDVPGRDSYPDLIRYNTKIFGEALK